MKWENLSKLVDIVQEQLNNYGHFTAEVNFGFDFRAKFNEAQNITILTT